MNKFMISLVSCPVKGNIREERGELKERGKWWGGGAGCDREIQERKWMQTCKTRRKRGNIEKSYQNDSMKVKLLDEFISISFCSYIIVYYDCFQLNRKAYRGIPCSLKVLDFKHDICRFPHLAHGPLLGILHIESK